MTCKHVMIEISDKREQYYKCGEVQTQDISATASERAEEYFIKRLTEGKDNDGEGCQVIRGLLAENSLLEEKCEYFAEGLVDSLAENEKLQEKVDYCTSMGLAFGIMKTSDKPEGFLQHTWDKNSDHERMFREWTAPISWLCHLGGRKEIK